MLILIVSFIPSLDDSKDEIRLLKVLPGKEHEEIHCQYLVVSLNDNPSYQTVSYAWGDPHKTRKIRVKGMKFEILQSLFSALSQIRLPDEEIVLWTDALCIDQANNVEKTYQVNLMDRIYRECSNCFIWVGDVDIDGEKDQSGIEAAATAFDMLRVLSGEITEDNIPPSITTAESSIRGSRALELMMHASWWSRIWTVQEACLPPSACVLWGPLKIQWKTLTTAAQNLVQDTLPFSMDYGELFPNDITSAFTPSIMGVQFALNWVRDGVPLLERIWRFRYRSATDPRDKIYGIKSLMGEESLPSIMSCDYSLDTATLFKRVTLDLLRDEKGLKPLIGWRGEKHMTPRLPTWAIDLTRPSTGLEMTARFWSHSDYWYEFTADAGLPMLDTENLTSEDESLLYVNGIFIDRVVVIGEVILEESEEFELTVDDLEPNIDSWRDIVTVFTESKAKEHGLAGMLRYAMITGMINSFDDLIEGRIMEEGEDNETWKKMMCKNQAMFITESGRIGLGPPTTQIGDELWILSGGRTPFVLRSREDVRGGEVDDVYEFVGDSFVHGIMFGEAVEGQEDTQRIVTLC